MRPVMKPTAAAVLLAAAAFCYPVVSFSQTSDSSIDNHPLDGFEDYLRTDELVLFWTEDVYNQDLGELERKVFSQIIFNDNQPDVDELIFQPHHPQLRRHEYNTEGFEPNFRGGDFHRLPVDVATGDFNGDGYESFIGGYAGDGVIHLVINELDPQRLGGAEVDNYDIPISNYEIRTVAESFTGGLFRLVAADLTRNGKDDLILAYRTDTDYMIEVFSVTDDLNLQPIGSYNAGAFPEGYAAFDIAVGKMTPDNRREIVFAYAANSSVENTVVVESAILSVEPGITPLAINSLGRQELYEGQLLSQNITIAVKTGDFTGNVVHEAAVGFNVWKSSDSNSSDDNLFVRIIDLADGQPAVWPGFDYPASIVNFLTAFTLDTGDVDGDGQDEIVVTNDGQAIVLRAPVRPPIMDVDLNEDDGDPDAPDKELAIFTDQNLNFSMPLGMPHYTSRYMVISDVNQRRDLIRLGQEGFSSEVIMVNDSDIDTMSPGFHYSFGIRVYGLESSASSRLRELVSDSFQRGQRNNSERGRSFALAAGDFTLSRIRYENPRRYQLTDIRQPWVILKAPPTHFDMFGETILDVNRCYGSNCGFSATFTSTETQGNSISTSVQSDWTVSGSSSVQHSIMSFGMDHKFGKGFGHAEFASTRESFTQTITATDTDRIYAAVSSFDLWEYDVYDAGEFVGSVLTVIPTGSSNTWLSSDSFFAYDYRSETEETNLLSYPRESTALQSGSVGRLLKGLEESDPSFVVGTGTASWSLEFEDFQSGENNDQSTVPIGGSLGLEKFTGFDLPGLYNTTEMTTNRVQVSNTIKIDVEMGTLNPQFPTASYTVYPYAYWHTDGPLVIDYAVRLDKQLLGGPRSFWDNRYGEKPDPALKLPWRYLQDKSELNAAGGTVEFDEDIIELSKSISYYPMRPQPDDTVSVQIDVHNFSLVDLDQLVDVHVYLGHPERGGERVSFLDGSDYLQTELILPLRGKETVSGRFIMPEEISERRLYAVIDPDATIDQIHANNNRGYVPMATEGVRVSIDDDIRYADLPEAVRLHQNYPNPFSPSTNIRYTLSTAGDVRLEVFNLLGQSVATLVSGHRTAGEHTVSFDASGLGSGVYFYQIEAGGAMQTMKMMLVR